jgi:cytidylate kinase
MTTDGHLPVIAIDGPAGSGKSTVARLLASKLGLVYLDTGAMYRAVTLAALRANIAPTEIERLVEIASKLDVTMTPEGRVLSGGEDITDAIRTREVDRAVSVYSAIPELRKVLVEKQRRYVTGGTVVEGRDIGTAVFPDAAVRVFLTASIHERARRRYMLDKDRTFEELVEDIEMRDRMDSSRATSPLRPAEGAVVIDTTNSDPSEVAETIAKLWADARFGPRG